MLSIKNVSIGFDGAPSALADVSLSLGSGQSTLVCGGGGSGKSVLLAAAAGVIPRLIKPTSYQGEVRFEDRPLQTIHSAELFLALGAVLQNLDDQLWNLGVEDLIAFSLENRRVSRADIRRQLVEAIERFGLRPLIGRMVLDLSGGERRMVALAAAIAANPRFLVLDEPTTGLDPAARARLAGVLGELRSGTPVSPTILIADQDAGALAPVADQLALLADGRIAANLPLHEAMSRPHLWQMAGVLAPGQRRPARRAGTTGAVQLEVRGLRSARHRARDVPVLTDVNLTLRAGEVTGLIGSNGAGKTTLFQSVLGLTPCSAERIAIAGEDARTWTPARRARQIGYLPQNMRRVLFNLTVIDEAAFAIAADTRTMRETSVRERARAALERYDLGSRAEANPFALSAREQALLGLACIDAARCRVAILDEPLLARDVLGRTMLERFLAGLRADGRAAILISHDLELVDDVADRLLILERGQLGFDGPTAEGWQSRPFTQLAWPKPYSGVDRAA